MTRDQFLKEVTAMKGMFGRPASRFFGFSAAREPLPLLMDKALTCFEGLPKTSIPDLATLTRFRMIGPSGIVIMATTDQEFECIQKSFGKPHFYHPELL